MSTLSGPYDKDVLLGRITELEAERDQLRESYQAILEINTQMVLGLKKQKAEAWDEGWIAGADDQKAWPESAPGNRATTDNPYLEAEVYLTHPPGAELGITVDGDD